MREQVFQLFFSLVIACLRSGRSDELRGSDETGAEHEFRRGCLRHSPNRTHPQTSIIPNCDRTQHEQIPLRQKPGMAAPLLIVTYT